MEYLRAIIAIGAFVLVGGLTVIAMARLLRGYLQEGRAAKAAARVPVVDAHPAAPLSASTSVSMVAGAVMLWGLLHVGVVLSWWASGWLVPRAFQWVFASLYAAAAAVISAVGAALMLRRQQFGRKMIAWGMFLFGVMAFMMGAASAVVPSDPRSAEHLRGIGYYLAAFFALHLLIDIVLGTAAQRVGRPAGWSELEAEGPLAGMEGQEPPDS